MTGLDITAGNVNGVVLPRRVGRLINLYLAQAQDQAVEAEIARYYNSIFNETGLTLATLEEAEAYLKQITQE